MTLFACQHDTIPSMAPRHATPMTPEALEMVASRFKVLSEPLRLRILQILEEGEKSVTELTELTGATQPNVSKHLRILTEAGFVGRRQEGNTVWCFIADPSVMALCDTVCGSLRDRFLHQAKAFEPPARRRQS